VTTKDGAVTLRGVVRPVEQHDRALTLARDTAGVAQVRITGLT
jgi:osmotically-inducible protein OsmY